MPGFSLTLLLLPPESSQSGQVLSLLDAPASATGWKWTSGSTPGSALHNIPIAQDDSAIKFVKPGVRAILRPSDPEAFLGSIKRACEALISAELDITEMDTIAGDGQLS
jgi:triose/dihydroxyacetone kinase / FAD-AMP lyase (cyclizing)